MKPFENIVSPVAALVALLLCWNGLQQYQLEKLNQKLVDLQSTYFQTDMVDITIDPIQNNHRVLQKRKSKSLHNLLLSDNAPVDNSDLLAPSPPAIKGESVTITENAENDYKFYGGKGDKPHLGGFTYVPDHKGVSHNLWNFMMG